MRNYRKLKELADYTTLDSPEFVNLQSPAVPSVSDLHILRMLVRPKYGEMKIPNELNFLTPIILELSDFDHKRTGIKDSWCYVTIRHGLIKSKTDDEWHFDGSSFRTDIIPERNYVWTDKFPTEYKIGSLKFPEDFDPVKHNLFTFAEYQLKEKPLETVEPNNWYLLSPFCLHRRPKLDENIFRTFYRICFTDIEGRDINNTENPDLPTPFFGRDPVKTFRNKLKHYYN